MRDDVSIAIIGAGPYGLSIAAHLRALGMSFRIFGSPMQTWISQMPEGMCLKSEGFASTLYDPGSTFTLKRFCQEKAIPYSDTGMPVRLDTFVAYGLEFQKRLVPELEERTVVSLDRADGGFRLELDNGEEVYSRRVVVAAGISHFQNIPTVLSGFPREVVSHSSSHTSMRRFQGRDVTVVGSGASALDLAALLKGAGATARVITRQPTIRFHNPPTRRSAWERIQAPMTGLGPGWRSLACVKGPLVFHRMPAAFRHKVVRKHLGPAPAWFTREAVVGHVELNLNSSVQNLELHGEGVRLRMQTPTGTRSVDTDHVIAATGFKVDLKRLSFLESGLEAQIRSFEQVPVLSTSFESSVKGLYFVGAAAAPSFGPLLRFAYGAEFAARHLSRHLSRVEARQPVVSGKLAAREPRLS